MYFSEKYKLLVIGIPKTGCKSIEDALLTQLDSGGTINSIVWQGKVFTSELFPAGQLGHARAYEFKEVLGDEIYNNLIKVVFIRNPYEKLVSIYHYTKSNPLFVKFKGQRKLYQRMLRHTTSAMLAKILPFWLWILVYPHRKSLSYYFDKNIKQIVDFVGTTSKLETDLNFFLQEKGIIDNETKIEVKKLNTSSHDHFKAYYKNILVKKLAFIKMKDDILDYERRFGSCL